MSQKPPLPDVDHPKFRESVRMGLQWLFGQRGNRIAKLFEVNRAITLTVSNPPTTAEVNAILAQTNNLAADVREIRAKINEILDSMHGPYP